MSGLKFYVIKGTSIRVQAIQLKEENVSELQEMYGGEVVLNEGVLTVVPKPGESFDIGALDSWLVVVDPGTAQASVRVVGDADFRQRFELYVEKEAITGSLFDTFKERLETHYEKLKADGQIGPEIDTEGLFEILANGLLMVENNEDSGLTIALAALLLHDRGEFTPAQLIEASQQDAK